MAGKRVRSRLAFRNCRGPRQLKACSQVPLISEWGMTGESADYCSMPSTDHPFMLNRARILLPPTGSSWIAVALAFRLLFMPPGLEDGLPDGWDADRPGPGDPRRSGPGPDASPGSSSGVRGPPAGGHARERRGGPGRCGPGSPRRGRVQLPGRPRPVIARRSR
jgi:hypothetical protein